MVRCSAICLCIANQCSLISASESDLTMNNSYRERESVLEAEKDRFFSFILEGFTADADGGKAGNKRQGGCVAGGGWLS